MGKLHLDQTGLKTAGFGGDPGGGDPLASLGSRVDRALNSKNDGPAGALDFEAVNKFLLGMGAQVPGANVNNLV